MTTLLIFIIIIALLFDFINGFHDAANSIATVVSTKVLTPFQAVVWAAAFNFLAYWVFELKVADTVAKTVKTEYITLTVVCAGIIAAIIWNLFTWWKGIPSSSSHTLIGGFAGAGLAAYRLFYCTCTTYWNDCFNNYIRYYIKHQQTDYSFKS